MRVPLYSTYKDAVESHNRSAAELREQTVLVEERVATLQHSFDALTGTHSPQATSYNGNPYPTYSAATEALAAAYEGTGDWGTQQVRNVVDLRCSFILGMGVKPSVAEGVDPSTMQREIAFIKSFMQYNDLDEELPQDWCVDAEIEGKLLCELSVDTTDGTSASGGGKIRANHLAWTEKKYRIITSTKDFTRALKAIYKDKRGVNVIIPEENLVWKRFGGRIKNVNDPKSKVAAVLPSLEDLDRALRDWRTINNLHTPTPVVHCETKAEVDDTWSWMQDKNWKIGKILVMTGQYSLVGLPPGSLSSIKDEIVNHARIISGGTGIPVQFLGLPDLLSSRATAENLMEVIHASTTKDRAIWQGFYEELFQKVLTLANEELAGGFKNVESISASIPPVSLTKLKELMEVWLPLNLEGKISDETLLSKIPEVDVEAELDRIKKLREQPPVEVVAGISAGGFPTDGRETA